MRLNTMILKFLDAPAIAFEHFRDWLEAGKNQKAPNPLLKRCYVISETHLSGARVIIGFQTIEDAQDAHEAIVRLRSNAN